jgi:lantibiotic modifying enzyme
MKNWKPIISQDNIIHYSAKIDEIYTVLSKRKLPNEIGILSGKMGICLFYIYYAKYKKNKNLESKSLELLDQIKEEILMMKIRSYIDVLKYSEYGWLVMHLHQMDMIDMESDYFDEIDEALHECLKLLISIDKYDCLNGAINIGIYFYNRFKLDSSCAKYLFHFISQIRKKAIYISPNIVKWNSEIDYETGEKGTNLGVAHGIVGLILFLSKLSNVDDLFNVRPLILQACNYMMSVEQNYQDYNSYFRGIISTNEKYNKRETRVGWCYGDLGVAYAFLSVSPLKTEKYQEIKNKGFHYLDHTLERMHNNTTGISDGCLCHGTSGVAHMYNRLYQKTGEERLKEAALYWYSETLKMGSTASYFAGFNVTSNLKWEKEKEKERSLSFLEGICGIGLSLISSVSDLEPNWDELLLLS